MDLPLTQVSDELFAAYIAAREARSADCEWPEEEALFAVAKRHGVDPYALAALTLGALPAFMGAGREPGRLIQVFRGWGSTQGPKALITSRDALLAVLTARTQLWARLYFANGRRLRVSQLQTYPRLWETHGLDYPRPLPGQQGIGVGRALSEL